ncbi:class I SAM-dependent methyltransferase [Thermopolyspora sp. NPDC052614]|uniref:class I SAM-dependent methyltransferase n=1 Tax=Thermopolyspora sp. NPDC052614 TaxID=3155682 RepID=UPI003447B4E3
MTDSRFTAAYWDERYGSTQRLWSGDPNAALVEEAAALTPGTALEAGCGEGADSLWLASQGWQVTAVDFSAQALRRAEAHTPEHLADRITWRQDDVRSWSAEPGDDAAAYDLVTAAFLHFPSVVRRRVFAALAARVAPGGHLLIIGHHPSDLGTAVPRPPEPDLFYTADDLAADLPASRWAVLTRSARARTATAPDGEPATIHDTVLHARRIR